LKKSEFVTIHQELAAAFPGSISSDPNSIDTWFKRVEDIDFQKVRRAADIILAEAETLPRGTNLGALLRNKTKPCLTASTIEGHLQHALLLAREPNGNPYAYLGGFSKRLLQMAESADLFSRDLTSDVQGIRVHKIAAQFTEEVENYKRGFHQTKPMPPERQIEGPKAQITEEQRQENLAKLETLQARFGREKGG